MNQPKMYKPLGFAIPRSAMRIKGGTFYVNIRKAHMKQIAQYVGEESAIQCYGTAPARKVFTLDFGLDEFPVTRGEFLSFIEEISPLLRTEVRLIDGKYWSWFAENCKYSDDAPVVSVSWWEASVFAWFNGGRLPTEEEWERASAAIGKEGATEECISAWSQARAEYVADPFIEEPWNLKLWTYLRAVDDPSLYVSKYGCKSMIGNANEWVASSFFTPVVNSDWANLQTYGGISLDIATGNRCLDKVVKYGGLTTNCPHVGIRSGRNTEYRARRSFDGGSIWRDMSVGFRCAYDA